MAALEEAAFLVPLAAPVAHAPVGQPVELGDELSLTPHLLFNEYGQGFAALFTEPNYVQNVAARLNWKTSDEPLEFCSVPAVVGLELARQLLGEEGIVALVINAGSDAELVLSAEELGNIIQRHPVPLVGYVEQIPLEQTETTLVAEPETPVSEEVVEIIKRCVDEQPALSGYRLRQTFNPERDLEPHLTLELELSATSGADSDPRRIGRALGEQLEGKLPPPGYIDVVFTAAIESHG